MFNGRIPDRPYLQQPTMCVWLAAQLILFLRLYRVCVCVCVYDLSEVVGAFYETNRRDSLIVMAHMHTVRVAYSTCPATAV